MVGEVKQALSLLQEARREVQYRIANNLPVSETSMRQLKELHDSTHSELLRLAAYTRDLPSSKGGEDV